MPRSSTVTMPEERHILALDGLRGVAILLVFLFHSYARPVAATAPLFLRLPLYIIEFGWTGVDLFFVLSGFLITRILLDARNSTNYFRVFYARRLLRIFPIYYLALALVFWILPFLAHHSAFFLRHQLVTGDSKEQIWYWLFLSNIRIAFHPYLVPVFRHYWTLSIEEQFYLFWPAVVYFCTTTRRLVLACSAGILAAFVLRQLPAVLTFNANPAHGNFLYIFTPLRLDTLFIGALIAVLFHQRTFTAPQRRLIFRAASALFLASFAVLIATASPDPANGRYAFTLFALFYAGLLTACLTSTVVARIFRFAPLRFLGKYSYCLYIIEPIVFYWSGIFLDHFIPGRMTLFGHSCYTHVPVALFQMLLCLGVARLSWLFIEQPILRFKKYFRYAGPQSTADQLHARNVST